MSTKKRFEVRPAHAFFNFNREVVESEINASISVTFVGEVDLTNIEQVRKQLGSARPSYTAFVAKAVALALTEFPYANRRLCRAWGLPFMPLRLQQFLTCDLAIACEREVPDVEVATFIDIMRDTEKLSLNDITDWLRALGSSTEETNKQWRDFWTIATRLPLWLGKRLVRLPFLRPSLWSKYRGGSALISAPCKYGVDMIAGTWMSPLGVSFGYAKDRVVARDGQAVVRPTFFLSLNFDRRVMAGAQAARFFKRIVEILETASQTMGDALPEHQPSPVVREKRSEPANVTEWQ